MSFIISLSMAVVSGIFLFASFPNFSLSLLAWIALVPLFLSISGKKAWYGFLLSLACGVVFFLGIFNWTLKITSFTFFYQTILALYLGSYFGLLGLAFAFTSRRHGVTSALFSAPFVWVALEYVRSNFFFLALPWGLLAHSQYQNLKVIQFASITGAYGVSFLIVMVNSAVTALVLFWRYRLGRNKPTFVPPISKQGSVAVVVPAALLLGLTLLYGHMTVSSPIVGDAITLSVVQGNIRESGNWNRQKSNVIKETYADLTRKAANDSPLLVVWPETTVPGYIDRNAKFYKEINRIVEDAQSYLLLGSSAAHRKFKNKKSGRRNLNSAILIHPKQKQVKKQRYDKIRLVPFGEYLPFKRTIPWSYIKIPNVYGYSPGKRFTVFELPSCYFGVTICWESIFSDLFRQFVKRGASFMINITDESWFGKTAAPYQFVSMNIFRAIENRVFLVRCANTGVSCFIDPHGRIVNRVRDENGTDIFVRGVLTGSVIPLKSQTFYTRYGDWPALLCLYFSVVSILFTLLKK